MASFSPFAIFTSSEQKLEQLHENEIKNFNTSTEQKSRTPIIITIKKFYKNKILSAEKFYTKTNMKILH